MSVFAEGKETYCQPRINKPRLINLGGPTKRVRICIVFYTARFMTRGRCLKFRRWLGCNHSEISREMRRWVGSGFRSKIQLQLYYILVTVHIYNAHTHAHTHTHTRTRTRTPTPNTYTYSYTYRCRQTASQPARQPASQAGRQTDINLS